LSRLRAYDLLIERILRLLQALRIFRELCSKEGRRARGWANAMTAGGGQVSKLEQSWQKAHAAAVKKDDAVKKYR
jgi:hypothetical protein